MTIIIGLGNPGAKFNHTRHNAGFMVLDAFASKNNFPDFEFSKKYEAQISKNNNVMLVKPETFMNDSGKTAHKLISNLKFQISNLVVVHDDIDLALGKIKFSKDSGPGGHKGVDSIINALGTKDFIRLKFGINNSVEKIKAQEIVLKKFSKEERELLQTTIEKAVQGLECFIEHGLEKTMNQYN